VVGGILAVMAGPVSAVLMLPIRSEWPVGGVHRLDEWYVFKLLSELTQSRPRD
jgi:hypothetical protein